MSTHTPANDPEFFHCPSCGDDQATPAFGRRMCTACYEESQHWERGREPEDDYEG